VVAGNTEKGLGVGVQETFC